MADDNPLLVSVVSTSPSTIIRKFNEGDPFGSLSRAWPCARCGVLLGIIHLAFSVFVLIFDIFTNQLTLEIFSTTAAVLYFVCALLCFIAVRRLDEAAQVLLLIFSSLSLMLSIALFIQNAHIVNLLSENIRCESRSCYIHAVLIFVGLSEGFICFITTLLCYRSLKLAFRVKSPYSPYNTLIVGDYKTLRVNPPLNNPRFNYRASTAFLQ
ncbi:unnamed protein product [Auanema sp. JU1783]|nr:unnamed protein product [Auanema sp. JU1783]